MKASDNNTNTNFSKDKSVLFYSTEAKSTIEQHCGIKLLNKVQEQIGTVFVELQATYTVPKQNDGE